MELNYIYDAKKSHKMGKIIHGLLELIQEVVWLFRQLGSYK